MTEQTKEIKKLAAWCQKTREILGHGVQGDSSKMEDQIDDVAKILKKMSSQTSESDKRLFEAGMESFRVLAGEHQRLKGVYDQAVVARDKLKKGTKQQKAQAEQLVTAAREKIRALMVKMADMKNELITDAPLAQAVHFFEISMRNAENSINRELTQEHADATTLNGALRTLTAWRKEVAEATDPVKITQLTQQINPLVAKLVRSTTQESSGLRKVDEKQSKARGAALEKLRVVKEMLAQLTTSGQLVPSIKTRLETAITAAELLDKQEKWIELSALLKPLPSRNACINSFDLARAEAGIDFAPELEQIRIALLGLKQQSDKATCLRFEGATKLLQGRAGDPARKVKDGAKLLQDFRTHIADMKAEIKYGIEASGRLVTQVGTLEQTAQTLLLVAPLNRVAENAHQIELIKLLQTERRWKEAEDTANLLQAAMQFQGGADYDKWKRLGPLVRGRPMTNDLRLAIGNPGATPALKEQAQRLLDSIAEGKLKLLEDARDWSSLVALHASVDQFALGLVKAIKQFKDFAGARGEADGIVKSGLELCASTMAKLERALTTAGADPAPVLKPLKARYEELKADWTKRVASAADDADLNMAKMEEELTALMQSIETANDGKSVKKTAGDQRDAAGKALFDKALLALENGDLLALEKLSVAKAAEFRNEIGTLSQNTDGETDPTKPWTQRLLGLQAIAGRVTGSISVAEQACTDLNRELTGKAAAVELVLSAAKKTLVDKGFWASVSKRYEPMFKFLEDELAGLRQLLATTNVTAAAGNGKLLEDLKKRADELVKLAMNNDAVDNREERVDTVEKRLTKLRDDGLDKLAAETNGKLGTQLKEMRRDMFGMEPRVMNQALDESDAALLAARTELDGVLAQKKKVTDLEADLRPRVGTLRQKNVPAAVYFDKLIERIGAAVEQAKAVAKLAESITALEALGIEVTEAEADPKAALSRLKLQNTEEHAQNRLEEEYKGRLSTLESKVVPRATRAIETAGGDRDQIAEVDRMIKLAKKAGEKKDFERAIQTLVRTENRIIEIEKNPAGTALGDRNALPKHLTTLAGQMNTLRDQLGLFVEAAVAQVPEASRPAVRKSLGNAALKVKAQLNPRMFDLYVGDVINTDKPIAERRAVRDQALQRLREFQTYITTQPTVVKLGNNPILPLIGPLRLVDSSLTRLQAHLRAAVRK